MNKIKAEIEGVYILEPKVFADARGYFFEAFNQRAVDELGFTPVQENCAYSLKKGTIRGLHFQNNPHAQAKLIRCVQGSVLDFAIDLRKNSPTYRKWVRALLSAENHVQLFIPKGFAHGVISLEDNTMIEYFADDFYEPTADRAIRYDDPDIRIAWETTDIIVSDIGKNAEYLRDSDYNF